MKLAAYALLGVALLLSAGCEKEKSLDERYEGTEISFSASTGYDNSGGTRTEYSGLVTEDGYERINWVSGDQVAIAYVHGSSSTASDYVVTTIDANSGRNSVASVAPATGQQKLTWDSGSGDHVFYAMYPANGFEGVSATLTTEGQVEATIPADPQTFQKNDAGKYLPPMKYGFLLSYKETSSPSGRVSLPFTPAVTTFEFRLQRGADEPDAKLLSVTLTSSSTPLTGARPMEGFPCE